MCQYVKVEGIAVDSICFWKITYPNLFKAVALFWTFGRLSGSHKYYYKTFPKASCSSAIARRFRKCGKALQVLLETFPAYWLVLPIHLSILSIIQHTEMCWQNTTLDSFFIKATIFDITVISSFGFRLRPLIQHFLLGPASFYRAQSDQIAWWHHLEVTKPKTQGNPSRGKVKLIFINKRGWD